MRTVLKSFTRGQRIRVVDSIDTREKLKGKTGTVREVVQGRAEGGYGWVELDCAIPWEIAAFPASHEKARWVLLFPDECEAL